MTTFFSWKYHCHGFGMWDNCHLKTYSYKDENKALKQEISVKCPTNLKMCFAAKKCRRRYPKSRVLRHSPLPCCFYSILAFNTWPQRSSGDDTEKMHSKDGPKKEVKMIIVRWIFDEMPPCSGYWISTQHENNYLSTSHHQGMPEMALVVFHPERRDWSFTSTCPQTK